MLLEVPGVNSVPSAAESAAGTMGLRAEKSCQEPARSLKISHPTQNIHITL